MNISINIFMNFNKGGYGPYRPMLDHFNYIVPRKTYDELKEELLRKESHEELERLHDRVVSKNGNDDRGARALLAAEAKKAIADESVYVISPDNPNKSYTCKYCGKVGHKESKCFTQMNCGICGKLGHPNFLCRNKKNGKGNQVAVITAKPAGEANKGQGDSKKVRLRDNLAHKHPVKKQKV